MLTVTAMNLKGSIIAARAYRHDGGREDRKSTIIMEGEGDLKKTEDLKTQNKSRQTVKVEELQALEIMCGDCHTRKTTVKSLCACVWEC